MNPSSPVRFLLNFKAYSKGKVPEIFRSAFPADLKRARNPYGIACPFHNTCVLCKSLRVFGSAGFLDLLGKERQNLADIADNTVISDLKNRSGRVLVDRDDDCLLYTSRCV